MSWRVTHIDHHGNRVRRVIDDTTRDAAIALMQQLLGDAAYLAAMRVGAPAR